MTYPYANLLQNRLIIKTMRTLFFILPFIFITTGCIKQNTEKSDILTTEDIAKFDSLFNAWEKEIHNNPKAQLSLHFQIFFHQDKKREIGIEKMKINEEIYRSIIAPKEESDRNIVPLEEVLLIDEAAMRRDLIMNVLNDDPENYIDMLKQARMNDDVEVVHYAITGMVELSKEYESRLQKIEYRYAKEPENQQLISEYCDFLQEYLSQGLLEGQMELVQRNQYIKLLKKKLKFKEDLHTYVCLAENQMQTKEYEQVLKSLERMDKKWHRNEEYWILRIRYYVELKQGKELKETLEQIQQEHIYLSAKGKEALAFWQE